MNTDSVVRRWKTFKAELDAVGSEQSRKIADFVFGPNENLEILIANLSDMDGERDFRQFAKLHRTIVAYCAELDSFLTGTTRFQIEDVRRFSDHFDVTQNIARLEDELTTARIRKTQMEDIGHVVSELLPQANHELFDDINCPEHVYSQGRRLLTAKSSRDVAIHEANSVLADAGNALERFAQKYPAVMFPRTTEGMENGVRRYLLLTAIAIRARAEFEKVNSRCHELEHELATSRRLSEGERSELDSFQRDEHPIYSTGRYAAHRHVVVPQLLVKLAQEFKSAGASISFNVSMD